MHNITYHTFIHENLKQFIEGFRYNAHPMGMLMATVSALSTFYPEASKIGNPENRMLQITRLIAKMPTLQECLFGTNRASRTSTRTTGCPIPRTSWPCCSR